MPDVDPLAFDIRFALTHKPIGREARKFTDNAGGASSRPSRGRPAINRRRW